MKKSYQDYLATGRITALLSLVLFIAGIYFLVNTVTLTTSTTPGQAEIKEIEYLYAYGSTTEIEGVISVVAAYEVDGVQLEAVLEDGVPTWEKGDTIEIRINKEDPTRVSYADNGLFLTGSLLGAVVCTVICVYNIRKSRILKKEMEELQRQAELEKQEAESADQESGK